MPNPVNLAAPIYDIQLSYLDNAERGPFFHESPPARTFAPRSQWTTLCGQSVASPIGIPAGPLLNERWTTFAATFGYDIVTYKTIRSSAYAGHPVPNVIYVEWDEPPHTGSEVYQSQNIPASMEELGITNSFGMPSRSPEYLKKDILNAKRALKPGQLLIVSIVGTPAPGIDLKTDFVRTAQLAKECGAEVIEANFSCPNVCSAEGTLYTDPKNAYDVAAALVKAIHPIPLIIKVGVFPATSLLQEVLKQLAHAGARAVCGINSVSMKVLTRDGTAALGPQRTTSGICGAPILQDALAFVREARTIIDREHLGLELLGCGGIVEPSHFDEFLNAGAQAALTATGMMWDPYLAHRWRTQ